MGTMISKNSFLVKLCFLHAVGIFMFRYNNIQQWIDNNNQKWPTTLSVVVLMLSIHNVSSNKTMKNLSTLPQSELKIFFDSFDTIVSDCDGVLWNVDKIPGVKESIEKLKAIGKKIHFVSNNSEKTKEYTNFQFEEIGIDLDPNDLIFPSLIMARFLNKQNFTKKAFVIGRSPFVQQFKDAGIQCVTANDAIHYSDTNEFIGNVTRQEPDIGAVVMDEDLNINYFAISKATALLQNPDVMFLVGAEDKVYKRVGDLNMPGTGYFSNIISQVTGRSPIVFGKPSESLKNVVLEQFKIADPKRVLFIGDTLVQDMGFASVCGFLKLFVLSGGNSLKDAVNTVNLNHIPDYWIDSLGHLTHILE